MYNLTTMMLSRSTVYYQKRQGCQNNEQFNLKNINNGDTTLRTVSTHD